ncbi:glycosyltransferase [Cohnella sp.]|uniref:glycosyltransferase n=1 Tax=Cohnella sp. TaxID=1883426 RepID=UPI003564BDD4
MEVIPIFVKIAFFVKPGLDAFLQPIIDHLSREYDTRKFVIRSTDGIGQAMEWADVCWFEWCDELIAHASRLPIAAFRRIVCRLHSYEAFTNVIHKVNWKVVDRLIFVGKPIQEYVLSQLPSLPMERTIVIPNGVAMERYPLVRRSKGFNIAYVGYVNYKKGPMLLLHAFKAIHDRDPRYRLHIAGKYQDMRYKLYFEQMIGELGLQGSVLFDGWQSDLNAYLKDKHYIISTSPLESQHMSVMEAMAAGVKPLVHHFYGAKKVYGEKWVWNTIDELVDRVEEDEYDSVEYRQFVESRYSFAANVRQIEALMDFLHPLGTVQPETVDTKSPTITIGIINCNYGRFLDECLQTAIRQSYPNKEILIIDDGSTDGSLERIESFRAIDPSIRLIAHPSNVGLTDVAIREIFQEASGDFALILSADDYLPHDRVLEEYMACFRGREDLEYVYGNLRLVDEAGRPTGQWTYRDYAANDAVRSIFQRMGSGVIPMIGLYKLAYYRDRQAEWTVDERKPTAGDTLNCLVNLRAGWKTQWLNRPVLCYRKHGNSISFQMEKRIPSLVIVLEYLIGNFSEEVYLPRSDWNSLGAERRAALKNFEIGHLFGRMARAYFGSGWIRHYSAEQKRECLKPLTDRMQQYFDLSLAADDAYRFRIEALIAETGQLMQP